MTTFERIANDFHTVTDLLNAFVQTFDEEYSVELGPDFEADDIEEKIFYAVAIMDAGATSFRANFIKRYPLCASFDIFTLSFMHELGHLETEWDTVDDTRERKKIKGLKDAEKYYALHNERIATDWAGEYLTENYDSMKAWESKILEAFKKILDKYPN
jgi:hypothetical protein